LDQVGVNLQNTHIVHLLSCLHNFLLRYISVFLITSSCKSYVGMFSCILEEGNIGQKLIIIIYLPLFWLVNATNFCTRIIKWFSSENNRFTCWLSSVCRFLARICSYFSKFNFTCPLQTVSWDRWQAFLWWQKRGFIFLKN
jgi:hypothetical protein